MNYAEHVIISLECISVIQKTITTRFLSATMMMNAATLHFFFCHTSTMDSSRRGLLQLYKKLLRSCETYPSSNRIRIYNAIREEWREHQETNDSQKIQKQLAVAYKGLSQLQQFNVETMTRQGRGSIHSANWEVHLEQNPMPKPADYDDRKRKVN
jgi:Complex 1 protein (LYR family)